MAISTTFHLMSQHRSGSKLLCTALNGHPEIACPHEPGTHHQGRLGQYRTFIEEIREVTQKPIVVYHHHWCFTTQEMLDDEFPKILLYREDELPGAIATMNLQLGRPNGLFEMNKERVKQRYEDRNTANQAMASYADLTISYEELTGGQEITEIPAAAQAKLLSWMQVDTEVFLRPKTFKSLPQLPSNYSELDDYAKGVG